MWHAQDLRQLVAMEADEGERAYWQLLLRQRTQVCRPVASVMHMLNSMSIIESVHEPPQISC